MERIEITDDMPQWKKDKIEATRKRVASLHKSKQDLIEGNASWSTVKEREMNEIKYVFKKKLQNFKNTQKVKIIILAIF